MATGRGRESSGPVWVASQHHPNIGFNARLAAAPAPQTRCNSGASHAQIFTPLLLTGSLQFTLGLAERERGQPTPERRSGPAESRLVAGEQRPIHPERGRGSSRCLSRVFRASNRQPCWPHPGPDTMADPVFQLDCNFRRGLCVARLTRHQRSLGAGSGRGAAAEICCVSARKPLEEMVERQKIREMQTMTLTSSNRQVCLANLGWNPALGHSGCRTLASDVTSLSVS